MYGAYDEPRNQYRLGMTELRRNEIPLVVIEIDDAREADLATMNVLYVIGSALDGAACESPRASCGHQ